MPNNYKCFSLYWKMKGQITICTFARSTSYVTQGVRWVSNMVHCSTMKVWVWVAGTEKKACSRGILRISTMGGPHSETHSIVERCSSSQASNQLTAISDLLSQPACVTSKRALHCACGHEHYNKVSSHKNSLNHKLSLLTCGMCETIKECGQIWSGSFLVNVLPGKTMSH